VAGRRGRTFPSPPRRRAQQAAGTSGTEGCPEGRAERDVRAAEVVGQGTGRRAGIPNGEMSPPLTGLGGARVGELR